MKRQQGQYSMKYIQASARHSGESCGHRYWTRLALGTCIASACLAAIISGCAHSPSPAACNTDRDGAVAITGIIEPRRTLVKLERLGSLTVSSKEHSLYLILERIDGMPSPRGFQYLGIVDTSGRLLGTLRYWGQGLARCEDDCIVLDVPQQLIDGDGEFVSVVRVSLTPDGKLRFTS
jgi:hypothetical protein